MAQRPALPFGLDCVQYEIDLSDENAQALRDELERYIEAGTRTGGRKLRVAAGQPTTEGGNRAKMTADRERDQQVRAWAASIGHAIAERGRIPNKIFEAFDNAEAVNGQTDVSEPESSKEASAKPVRKRAPRRKKADS